METLKENNEVSKPKTDSEKLKKLWNLYVILF